MAGDEEVEERELFNFLREMYHAGGEPAIRELLTGGQESDTINEAFAEVMQQLKSGEYQAEAFHQAAGTITEERVRAGGRRQEREEKTFKTPAGAQDPGNVYTPSTIPDMDVRGLAEALGEISGGQPDTAGMAWKLKETLETVSKNQGAIIFRQATAAIQQGDPGKFNAFMDMQSARLEKLGLDADEMAALKTQVVEMAGRSGRGHAANRNERRSEGYDPDPAAFVEEEKTTAMDTPAELQSAMDGVEVPQSVMNAIFDDKQHIVMGTDGTPHLIDLRDGLSQREIAALQKVIHDGDVTEDCPGGKLLQVKNPRSPRGRE